MSEITINIKCSNADKATVTIEKEATVLNLKERISEVLSVPATQQRLIYKGKVLKDEATVESYDIQNEHTVHMVKGAGAAGAAASTGTAPATTASTPASSTSAPGGAFPAPNSSSPASNPFGAANPFANPFGGMGGLGALGGLGAGSNGMPDINRMQEQMLRNPEMMQQIMNSPMMSNLFNNPELMRDMMLNNPQMQAMLDANPQIRHILNDPAVSVIRYELS